MPVVDRRLVAELEALVERLEMLAVVSHLQAVGPWYERFEQLDDSVCRDCSGSGADVVAVKASVMPVPGHMNVRPRRRFIGKRK